MNSGKKTKISFILIFLLMVQLFIPYMTSPVFAQNPNGIAVIIDKVTTGTEPFNTTGQAGPGFYPGDDYSKDDTYVRTLDTVQYKIDYEVNPANTTANNAVLTATLSTDAKGNTVAVWDESLKKYYSGLIISDDGRTFNYRLGSVDGGNAYSFSPTAKIVGTAKNGSTFNMDVTFSADHVSSTSASTSTIGKEITVSAFPKLDLAMDIYKTRTDLGPSGELGVVVYSTIEVLITGGKGSELVDRDISFNVDLSQLKDLSPQIYNFSGNAPAAKNGDYGWIQYNYARPEGKNGGEKGVTNSGNFIVTQSAPGEDVQITISEADLSGNHTPSKYPNGNTIALDDKYVVSGYLALWIPADKIPNGEKEIVITYTDFDPTSISNQSNFGDGMEPTENNTDRYIVRKPVANANASFDEYYSDLTGQKLPVEMDLWDFDGVIVSGGNFITNVRFSNPSFVQLNDVIVVNKFDPKLVELVEKSPGIAHELKVQNMNADDIVVEYGVGGSGGDAEYDDWIEQRDSTGDDQDSTGGWYTNIDDAPCPITKIRWRAKDGVAIQNKGNVELKIYMKAKDNPIGTKIPNFMSVKVAEMNSGNWIHSKYNPDTDTNRGSTADRVTITGVKARIEVKANKSSVVPGGMATFALYSSLTSEGNDGIAKDVTITNTLPEGITYIPNSTMKNLFMPGDEPQITKNTDGTTTLTWKLGDRQVNKYIETISYDVNVDPEATDMASLNNVAVISTPTDISKESARTSQDSVTVTDNRAWGISKRVDKDIVEIEEDLVYTLRYFQRDDETFTDFEFIEILPYNGDGRTPNTNFTGTYKFKSIIGNHGETFLVTDVEPESINKDPKNSHITWQSIDSIPVEDVTAVKISVASFPPNETAREIKLILEPVGNKGGDIYTNRFTGRVSNIDALVQSNDVSIQVVDSSVGKYVWNDADGDGIKGDSEIGMKDVTLKIYRESGGDVQLIATTKTDENGEYSFEELKSEEYIVEVDISTLPQGAVATYDLDGGNDSKSEAVLSKDQDRSDVNFGYQVKDNGVDIEVSKKVNDPTPQVGEEIEYTIQVKNNGPNDATGVIVEDILPSSLDYVSHDEDREYNHENGKWTIGNLQNSETVTLTIKSKVNTLGTIKNIAKVINVDQYDKAGSNDQDDAIVKTPGLNIIKKVSNALAEIGDRIKYMIRVENTGETVVKNVYMEDSMDISILLTDYNNTVSGSVYESVYGSVYKEPEYENGQWIIGDLYPGGYAEFEGSYTVKKEDGNTTLINMATAHSDNTEAVKSSVETKVISHPAINLVKTGDKTEAKVGDGVVYTFEVTNTGDVVLENVAIEDPMLGTTLTPWKYSIGKLNVGQKIILEQTYVIPEGQSFPIINTAKVIGKYKEEVVTDTDSFKVEEKIEDSSGGPSDGSSSGGGSSTPKDSDDNDKKPNVSEKDTPQESDNNTEKKSEEHIEVPEDDTPQGSAKVPPKDKKEETVDVPEDDIPKGEIKVLPKTGEGSPIGLYLLGILSIMIGIFLRRRIV